jgi:hypothetical protein
MWRGWRPVLFVLLAAAGCLMSSEPVVYRAAEGPRADDIFNERFVRSYGRVPTFEETFVWREELNQAIATYFVKHPDVAISPRSQHFRLHRRVALGMSKEEVMVLVGRPAAATSDPKAMEMGAKQFWPEVRLRAKEMWLYPPGWRLYFDDDRLVDITLSDRPLAE